MLLVLKKLISLLYPATQEHFTPHLQHSSQSVLFTCWAYPLSENLLFPSLWVLCAVLTLLFLLLPHSGLFGRKAAISNFKGNTNNNKNTSYTKYGVFFVLKIFLILLVFFLCGCENAEKTQREELYEQEETQTETNEIKFYSADELSVLSTKKQSWGMRRNPPERPQFTQEQTEAMDKYGCIYMGSDEEKYLYLTFDEGYENGQSEKILNVLKDKNVTAAFFITGDYFKGETALVDRMVYEGHTVGNHTMNHPCIPSLETKEKMEEELLSLDRAFYERYNRHMKYFRPPEGAYCNLSLAVAQNLGYTHVFWSFAYDDWYRDKQRGADYAYNKTLENLHNGEVILLHAVSADNANALADIIDTAREMGYEFRSLDDYIP